MTALELITEALLDIGAIDSGAEATPDEAQTGLAKLNGLLDSWSTERISIPVIQAAIYNLVAGQTAYTIGPSASDFLTLNTQRPIGIESANIIADSTRFALKLFSSAEFAAIAYRTITGSVPYALYYDNAFPNATINLWDAPSAGHQLELFTWKPLTQVAKIGDDLVFPPGYREAVLYNLELRMVSLGQPPNPVIVELAAAAKANIQRLNLPSALLDIDQAIQGDMHSGYVNISTGGNWFV